ncbi:MULTISPECIES: hypothetical protein [Luteibacter]|uniref:hypothetical protein n=1 Tax=Luteibacter TaxID=242605 RepID=UPI00055EAFA7|nr:MULTISPECIES: hypothetical protein [unclassified Luteibacter]SKB47180.1 hypothetical protein SAMN05660880_01183 [Luteibacter sp. 22Crub2.1]
MTNRDELRQMLERLDSEVTTGLRDNPDRDAFWPEFAMQSNAVLEAAGDEHFDWVSAEIADMLHRHGIPAPEA